MQKHSTARSPKTQLLTHEELKRSAEKLAAALEQDPVHVGILCLLFDNLSKAREDFPEFNCAVYTIKKYMFVNTSASDEAQDKFEAASFKNRGKLLLWPGEETRLL